MTAYPVMPGVPAAGHVTSRGYWHPGAVEDCDKCGNAPSQRILKGAYCERCGYEPRNRSQALNHAATCGSIVRERSTP